MEKQQPAKLKAQFNLFAMIAPCQFIFQDDHFLIEMNQNQEKTFEPNEFISQFLNTRNQSLQFSTSNEVFNLSGKIHIESEDNNLSKIRFVADNSEDYLNYAGTQNEQT